MTRAERPHAPARSSHRSASAGGALRAKPKPKAKPAPKATAHKSSAARGTSRKGGASPRSNKTPHRRPEPFVPGHARRGRRLTVSYDLEGPRVTLGVIWFVVVFAALVIGRAVDDFPVVGLVYGAVAVVAAAQVVDAWYGSRVLRVGAMVIAAVVGISASFGVSFFGGALLAAVGVGLVVGATEIASRRPLLPATGLVLQGALPPAVVAASVVTTMHYEIGACVTLLAMAMAFDVGDFLIGSGAGSLLEGPVAGGLMILLVAAVVAIIGAPPFDGALVWVFAVGAIVACPLGQVAASWLLPDATTRASALRRVDSLLITAPVWAFATGLVVAGG